MKKSDKLFTANKWNRPQFARNVDRVHNNIFDGEDSSQIPEGFTFTQSQIDALGTPDYMKGSGTRGINKFADSIGGQVLSSGMGAVGGTMQSVIGGGFDDGGVGSKFTSIAGSIKTGNPLIDGAISLGSNLLGGLLTRALGVKYNEQNISNIENNNAKMQQSASALRGASTTSDLASMGSINLGGNFLKRNIGKAGWAHSAHRKLDNKFNALQSQRQSAKATAIGAMANAADNIDANQDDVVAASFKFSDGGFLGQPMINSTGMGAIDYGFMSDYLLNKTKQAENKNSNITNSFAGVPNNIFALGGDVQMHGGDYTTGLTHVLAGQSHEENPYDGVQMGIAPDGKPNLVEEGETVFNDYVYSNRISIDDETKKRFHISKKRDMTYADLSKKLERESAERPNDPISRAALKLQMQQLAEQQERQKKEIEAQKARDAFEALTPEEQTSLMQYAQQVDNQEQTMQEQAMMEQMAAQQGQPSEEELMQQQMMQEAPQEYAKGGHLFDLGGEIDSYLKKNYKGDARHRAAIAKAMAFILKDSKGTTRRSVGNDGKIKETTTYFNPDTFKRALQLVTRGNNNILSNQTRRNIAGYKGSINDLMRVHFKTLTEEYGMPADIAFELSMPSKPRLEDYGTTTATSNAVSKNGKLYDYDLYSKRLKEWEAARKNFVGEGKYKSAYDGRQYQTKEEAAQANRAYLKAHPGAQPSVTASNSSRSKVDTSAGPSTDTGNKGAAEDATTVQYSAAAAGANPDSSVAAVTGTNAPSASGGTGKATRQPSSAGPAPISFEEPTGTYNPETARNNIFSRLGLHTDKDWYDWFNNNQVDVVPSRVSWTPDEASDITPPLEAPEQTYGGNWQYADALAGWNPATQSWEAGNELESYTPVAWNAEDHPIESTDWTSLIGNQRFRDAIYNTTQDAALRDAIERGYDFGNYTAPTAPLYSMLAAPATWDDFSQNNWKDSKDKIYLEAVQKGLIKDGMTDADFEAALKSTDAYKNTTSLLARDENARKYYLQQMLGEAASPGAREHALKFIDENGNWREGVSHTYDDIFKGVRDTQPGNYWHTLEYNPRKKTETNYVINDDGTVEVIYGDVPTDWKDAGKYSWQTDEGDIAANYYRRPSAAGSDTDTESTDTEGSAGSGTPEIEPVHKASWLRYSGLLSPAVGLGMQLAGVGKPDYKGLDAALDIVNNGGAQADYKPIGNYLKYTPMDIWANQNRRDANARASDRAILNRTAPTGTVMSGLIANNYNNQLGSAELYRQALEYNDNNRARTADFNRGTDMFNAQAYNQNQQFNAAMRNRQNQLRASLAMDAARTKLAMDNDWYRSIYGNVGGIFEGLGDIGKENYQHNMLADMAADGLFGNLTPGRQYVGTGYIRNKNSKKSGKQNSKGGKINRKRGLTF